MKKESILLVVSGLIAALFFYAAMAKLMDYDKSLSEMRNQIFPVFIAKTLTWLIPVIEIVLSLLLLFPSSRKMALWASLFLLIAFTLYIAIVMTGVFGRIPCSCGGILENMSYGNHLMFNLFFIAIAIFGLLTENNKWFNFLKERRLPKN